MSEDRVCGNCRSFERKSVKGGDGVCARDHRAWRGPFGARMDGFGINEPMRETEKCLMWEARP